MSEFQSLSGLVGNISTGYGTSTSETGELGKDEFLKLMITQLNYQDPLNPMDSSEFSAQLAQFTSVEQLSNLTEITEDSFQADMLLAQSINNTMSANIIGKDIKAITDSVTVKDGEGTAVSFELANPAREATLSIYDSAGNLVRSIAVEEPEAGIGTFEWDGKDDSGNTLVDGSYSVSINITDQDGNTQRTTPFIIGQVEAVRYDTSGAVLIVDGQAIAFGNVLEIREPGNNEGGNAVLSLFGLDKF